MPFIDHVTLDGRPARVTGYKAEFATVRTLDGRLSAELAWTTALRIIEHGGDFRH